MKVYEYTIKLLSAFGTPLKGDTVFGHFCWQVAHDPSLIGLSIDEFLSHYSESPLAVFSSAFPLVKEHTTKEELIMLKRPEMPLSTLFNLSSMSRREAVEKRKEIKSKRWMPLKRGEHFESFNTLVYQSDKDVALRLTGQTVDKQSSLSISDMRWHNTIDRKSGSTGEDRFAPFAEERQQYIPELECVLWVGIEPPLTAEAVMKGLERTGASGFGRDASTGAGRFNVCSCREWSTMGSNKPNALYTLAPSVPEEKTYFPVYFNPFTRFGRHGDLLACSRNPFKNPVIMADEGAVFMPMNDRQDVFLKPYMGRGITGISKAEPRASMQGYSLYIPVKVEV